MGSQELPRTMGGTELVEIFLEVTKQCFLIVLFIIPIDDPVTISIRNEIQVKLNSKINLRRKI